MGDRSLNRGRYLFEGLDGNTEQAKQEFYLEFLKSLQLWALCYPSALKIKGRDSKVKFLYEELRSKLKLDFPEDKNLKDFKAEFDRNLARKKLRNAKLLSEFTDLDSELVPLKPLAANDPQKSTKALKQ